MHSNLVDGTSIPRQEVPVLKRKTSFFVSREKKNPMAVHILQFYRELRKWCSISQYDQCQGCLGGCGRRPSVVLDKDNFGMRDGSLALLQTLAEEGTLSQLQHQLYLKEIQQLNPNLSDGYLFVDGLYELVSGRVPWPCELGGLSIHHSPRDLLTMNNSGVLLLQNYWLRPDDPAEITSYLTIAVSFVQYVFTTFGPGGVAQFLKQMPCDGCVPDMEMFHFKRKSLLTLEFKWKRFVEAEVNSPFRLSILGMIWLLIKDHFIHHWFKFVIIMLSICVNVGFHLGFSIAFSQLLSLGFTRGELVNVGIWSSTVLALIIFRFFLVNFRTFLVSSVAVQVSSNLRYCIAKRIHNVSYKFLSDHSPSTILSTFSEDISNIEKFISVSMTCILWAMLMLLTCIVYAIVIVWPIGIPLALVYISTTIFTHWISTIIAQYNFVKMQALNKVTDLLKETIDGFQENRIYRRASFWLDQIESTLDRQYTPKARHSSNLSQFIVTFQLVIPHIIGITLMFGIILLSMYEWVDFQRGLSVYLMYQLTIVAMSSSTGHFTQMQATQVGLGRINALLNNIDHFITDSSINTIAGRLKNNFDGGVSVEFDNVCFSYSQAASHWTLYNVSFKIRPGERVAIVGRTGSGKSTILNLLLQMYLPTTGKVIINDKVTTGCPDGSVAATFQTNHMFGTSLRENIRFGNLQATDAEVEEAAQMADIHNWIASLSRGYDTIVKPGGTSLSGGQRQRIAIARMLVAKSPVLLFDEVTSALDPATESRVFQTLMDVTQGRTVIAVTHRLEQAEKFDSILVFSHGRLKERGTHQELMLRQSTYYQMAQREKGVTSPCRPTPILRRHSLVHISHPSENLQSHTILTTPLQTVNEEDPNMKPNVSFATREELPETPLPIVVLPSAVSTPI